MLEQAVATEALRLSLEYHKSLTRGLKGIQQKRQAADIFNQTGTGETLVRMMETGLIVGSGGALSHAPRRSQAALILLNAFQPEGVTELWADNQFLLPYLGALLDVDEEAAGEILEKEALVSLATVVCPVGPALPEGALIARVNAAGVTHDIAAGDLSLIPVPAAGCEIEVTPRREFDVGKGKGQAVTAQVHAGIPEIIFDGRSRPLTLPQDPDDRISKVRRWHKALSAYPDRDSVREALAMEVS